MNDIDEKWTIRRRAIGLVLAGAIALVGGCKMPFTRSASTSSGAAERDPFVMSHLTHGKGDPSYAGSENESSFDSDRDGRLSSTVARKPESQTPATPVRKISYRDGTDSEINRADDYRWLSGRLLRRQGRDGGWFVRYASAGADDRYGGELRLAGEPRLGLLREGDQVQVEGTVIEDERGQPVYRCSAISLCESP